MRKKLLPLLLLLSVSVLAGTPIRRNSSYEQYIDHYKAIAIEEMRKYGIPASITLAQGLLESGAGQSELAQRGNNHFGIKCHDWTGKKMYQDDDEKGECFRVYSDASESFADHSDFLRYRDRYKSLFNNEITDYKAWAYGLKAAGYATDPSYPVKLIKLVEDYHLYDYDKMKPGDFTTQSEPEEKSVKKSEDKPEKATVSKSKNNGASTAKMDKRGKKNRRVSRKGAQDEIEVMIPESPLSIEEPKKLTGNTAKETFSFSLTRQLYSVNGVPFIYSKEGETYASIASDYNLFLKEILRYNDDDYANRELTPGTIVYLQAKKSQTVRGLDKYISDEGGESLRDISQRFAVKLKDLCKMNGLSESYVTVPGDEINLRMPSGR